MKGFAFLSFLVPFLSLNAIGIKLNSGEYFVGELLNEDSESVEIEFNGASYSLLKSNIARMERQKETPIIIHTFQMKDGSMISGVVAREEAKAFTLKTVNGFEIIEKGKIKETSYAPEPMQDPPERFRVSRKPDSTNTIGIFFAGYSVLTRERIGHPRASGGGVFFEPTFFDFPLVNFGSRLEYIEAPGRAANLVFVNGFLYAFWTPEFSSLWRFYFSAEVGGSYISFGELNGTAPAVSVSASWAPDFETYIDFRFGLRGMTIYEQGRPTSFAGIEFAGVVTF